MKAIYWSFVSLLLCATAWGGDLAVDFDGVDDYVGSGVSGISTLTAGTYSAWVNVDASAVNEIFFSTSNEADSENEFLIAFEGSTDKFRAEIGTNGSPAWVRLWKFATDNTFAEGNWYHVALVHDGTAATFYVDGALEAITYSVTTDKTVFINGILTSITAIGTLRRSSGNVSSFGGTVAAVLIYNRAITAQEIATMYATRGKTYPRNGLVLDIDNPAGKATGNKLDGLTFPDRSGSGNSGTGVDGTNNTGLVTTGTIIRRRGPRHQ
jgi:hypothetical protein